jgi:hypothetical protein
MAQEMAREQDNLAIKDSRTGRSYTVPIENGTIRAMDLRQIKTDPEDFGLMTYDPAFMNTASCRSTITFIDGDRGILRYRGYPIEVLAEHCSFLEVAFLLLFGELPTESELKSWVLEITHHTMLHENTKKFMEGFRYDAHPMAMLVSTVAALSTIYPEAREIHDAGNRMLQIKRLIGKTPSIAAMSYRHNAGLPYVYPDNDLSYTENFMNMLWKKVEPKYSANPALAKALDILFILHADHEQNCSTNAMRSVGSSQADPFLSTSAAAAALSGPHARRNRFEGKCSGVCETCERRTRPADGLRASRLQELRSAGQDYQVDGAAGVRGYGTQSETGDRAGAGAHRARGRLLHQAQALSQRRFLFGDHLPGRGVQAGNVHRAVCDSAHGGMAGAVAGVDHRS